VIQGAIEQMEFASGRCYSLPVCWNGP